MLRALALCLADSLPVQLTRIGVFLSILLFAGRLLPGQEESYPLPPEAQRQEGVPEGKIEGPFSLASKIYPGTEREYWIYVPAQYDASKPACTLIVQDGMNRANGWNIPTICDNLIHKQQMPVTVGIFVSPGVVPAITESSQPRFNRSFEYDSLGDRYARFLLEELVPEVSKRYALSTDPNDRALAGSSSGGICAFNAAWERPDAFRRVICTVGTFVGLRGGDQFPVLVRKFEPKPLRIFMQDGSHDLNIYAGDWWMANQSMLSALQWAGYDVHHIWGEGGHNAKHSTAIMPQAMRWLWRDYPQPIHVSPNPSATRRTDILVPGTSWIEVSSGHEMAEAPTCNAAGELFFCDSKVGRIYRVGEDNKTRIFADQTGRLSGLAFGPGGYLYACKDSKQIVRFSSDGKESQVIAEMPCQSLVTLPDGFYVSSPGSSAIWWSSYEGGTMQAMQLSENVTAMAPTADHAFLHLAMPGRQFTYHAQIGQGRQLAHRQQYGFLHMPYLDSNSGATGLSVDTEGRAYVASKIGVQVMDQLGRVHLIMTKPSSADLTGLVLGGAHRDALFVTAGQSVYRRSIKAKGLLSFEAPVLPPKPRL